MESDKSVINLAHLTKPDICCAVNQVVYVYECVCVCV